MDVLEELEVDAQQRWMADVLVELVAIHKLLAQLAGKQNLLTHNFEAKGEPRTADTPAWASPYEYETTGVPLA